MYPAYIDANRRYVDQHSALYQNLMIDLVNLGIADKDAVENYLGYSLPARYLISGTSGTSGVSGE